MAKIDSIKYSSPMKNRLLILALLIVSNFADASQLTIDHPCLIKPILSVSTSIDSSTEDLFSFTKKQITDQNIVAVLANNGIISILNYVSQDKAIEVINDTKIRAYGWCYSINGEIPDVMPDQIKLTNQDNIKWFLSYSTYDNGQWIDYCVPVNKSPEATQFICH